MRIELKVPKVGESVTEVELGAWTKSVGDAAKRDEPLVSIETDKATVELLAPVAGTITTILKKEGEKASVGEVVGYMDEGVVQATAALQQPTAPAAPPPTPSSVGQSLQGAPPASAPAPTTQVLPSDAPRVTPVARRAMEAHGLSVEDVRPPEPAGRVFKDDVLKQVQEGRGNGAEQTKPPPRPPPSVVPSGARTEEVVRMTPIRRKIAERLVEAQNTAALLTTFNEIDMSAVLDLRKSAGEAFLQKFGVKLGFMSFFVKASIEALKMVPQINAEVRGTDIAYRNYYDIGVAVGGGKGLVVPVLRNAERMSFADIEAAIADFAKRAKDNKLVPDELQGGTFTISNGGVYGSLLSTPIVNPPQSGVLGLHAIQDRPVVREGAIVAKPMMYVAMTYDHRIVDGREAVTFLKRIKEVVESPARMILEV
jgi:2-oxoglutarate dehydrogenase E2 component (dihydrolipoamide succinyltransferase)